MFRSYNLHFSLLYSIAAAILYSATAWIFLYQRSFSQSWVLYIGNILFAIVIGAYIFSYNKKRDQNAKAMRMIGAGHLTTIIGIIFSSIFCLVLIIIFVQGISNGNTVNDFQKTPAQMSDGTHHELMFSLFMNAIIGNLCGGSFVSILLSSDLKKNQNRGG